MPTGYADAPVAAAPNGAAAKPIKPYPGLSRRQRLDQRHQQAWQPMTQLRPIWESLALYVDPARPLWCTSTAGQPRFTEKILDNKATIALRTLAAGMASKLSNPAVPWFELTTTDATLDRLSDVKRWLATVRDRILMVMDRSNFYAEAETVYADTALFGTSAMTIEADPLTVVRCEALPIGSYAIGQDARRRVNELAREYEMTAQQMMDEFGADRLSLSAQMAMRNGNGGTRFVVRHMIYPNPDYVPRSSAPSRMQYAECYWQTDEPATSDKFLREGGYHEFPVPSPRWGPLSAGDIYGTKCPGMTAHGDVKMLQKWERSTLNAYDKMITPPTVSGPGFKNKPIYSIPGGNTVDESFAGGTGGNPAIQALYQVAVNLQQAEAKAEQIRNRIAMSFYEPWMAPFLSDERNQRQTAAEAYIKRDEQYGLLGSVVERNSDDFHDPAIARYFGLMVRAGEIPPPPQQLIGKPLRVRLVSAIAAAQKSVGVSALERHMTALIQVAAQAPQLAPILDTLNADEWARLHAEATGTPPSVTRDENETAQVREVRQQAMAAAQQQAQVPVMAKAAKDLSETNVTDDNALTRIAGDT